VVDSVGVVECRKIFAEMFSFYFKGEPKGSIGGWEKSNHMKFGLACFEAGRVQGKRDGVNEVVAVNESIGRIIAIPEWFRKGKGQFGRDLERLKKAKEARK
jgi:hypothetical protein